MGSFFITLLLIIFLGGIFLCFFFVPLLELTLQFLKIVFYLILGVFYLILWILKFTIYFILGPIAFVVHALINFIRRQPQ